MEACGGEPDGGTWLDVTDGWDEAGVLAYRLYAYFLMALLKPKNIVAPVGTGGLFVGFMLGMSDYLDRHANSEARLVGAVPVGARSTIPPLVMGAEPVAPKLFGPYSPLGLILSALQKSKPIFGRSASLEVSWARVDLEAQSTFSGALGQTREFASHLQPWRLRLPRISLAEDPGLSSILGQV